MKGFVIRIASHARTVTIRGLSLAASQRKIGEGF